MTPMKTRRTTLALVIVLALLGLCIGGLFAYDNGRPLQVPVKERLYKGVDYARKVTFSPRPLMIHGIVAGRKSSGRRQNPAAAISVHLSTDRAEQLADCGLYPSPRSVDPVFFPVGFLHPRYAR